MNTKLRSHTGLFIIVFILISTWWGCAGVGQKFDDWQSSLRQSLSRGNSDVGSSGDKTGDQENLQPVRTGTHAE